MCRFSSSWRPGVHISICARGFKKAVISLCFLPTWCAYVGRVFGCRKLRHVAFSFTARQLHWGSRDASFQLLMTTLAIVCCCFYSPDGCTPKKDLAVWSVKFRVGVDLQVARRSLLLGFPSYEYLQRPFGARQALYSWLSNSTGSVRMLEPR